MKLIQVTDTAGDIFYLNPEKICYTHKRLNGTTKLFFDDDFSIDLEHREFDRLKKECSRSDDERNEMMKNLLDFFNRRFPIANDFPELCQHCDKENPVMKDGLCKECYANALAFSRSIVDTREGQ